MFWSRTCLFQPQTSKSQCEGNQCFPVLDGVSCSQQLPSRLHCNREQKTAASASFAFFEDILTTSGELRKRYPIRVKQLQLRDGCCAWRQWGKSELYWLGCRHLHERRVQSRTLCAAPQSLMTLCVHQVVETMGAPKDEMSHQHVDHIWAVSDFSSHLSSSSPNQSHA